MLWKRGRATGFPPLTMRDRETTCVSVTRPTALLAEENKLELAHRAIEIYTSHDGTLQDGNVSVRYRKTEGRRGCETHNERTRIRSLA